MLRRSSRGAAGIRNKVGPEQGTEAAGPGLGLWEGSGLLIPSPTPPH